MQYNLYSRPLKGSNESGFFLQVVFKCRFYYVDLRRAFSSEQWSFKAGGLLIQVVSNTGLTLLRRGFVCIEKRLMSYKLTNNTTSGWLLID